MVTCPSCGRHFSEDALPSHFVYGVKPHQDDLKTDDRKRCGSDTELKETCGLKYHGWPSMSGQRDDYWTT
jgi:hypothetical protein